MSEKPAQVIPKRKAKRPKTLVIKPRRRALFFREAVRAFVPDELKPSETYEETVPELIREIVVGFVTRVIANALSLARCHGGIRTTPNQVLTGLRIMTLDADLARTFYNAAVHDVRRFESNEWSYPMPDMSSADMLVRTFFVATSAEACIALVSLARSAAREFFAELAKVHTAGELVTEFVVLKTLRSMQTRGFLPNTVFTNLPELDDLHPDIVSQANVCVERRNKAAQTASAKK